MDQLVGIGGPSHNEFQALSDQIANIIKYVDVDGTTDASGNITSDTINGVAIIAIPIRNATGYYTNFYTVTIGSPVGVYDKFVLHCISANNSVVASSAVKIRLFYI